MEFEFCDLLLCSSIENHYIPNIRNNEVYCDNCKNVGYINKVKNDPYMTAYRNEYKNVIVD